MYSSKLSYNTRVINLYISCPICASNLFCELSLNQFFNPDKYPLQVPISILTRENSHILNILFVISIYTTGLTLIQIYFDLNWRHVLTTMCNHPAKTLM
jgi:hypothetical protein